MIMEGERIIKITSDIDARKYGNWYKGLVGKAFSVIMYSIMEAEYVVQFQNEFKRLPDSSITIIKE